MATSTTTTDHEEIRAWAEERDGVPACVKGTGVDDGDPGILRIDFGEPDDDLDEISWDEWFDKFEAADLAFVHQDETAGGDESRFFKLIER
jgi:hypothetical protein